jgi:hypothetical protein
MPPLLLQLWREQHPDGHKQVMIDFTLREKPAEPVALFPEEKRCLPAPVTMIGDRTHVGAFIP